MYKDEMTMETKWEVEMKMEDERKKKDIQVLTEVS